MGEQHHQEKAKVGGKLEWLQANQIGIIFDDDRELLEERWHNGVWVYAVHPNPKRSSSPVYSEQAYSGPQPLIFIQKFVGLSMKRALPLLGPPRPFIVYQSGLRACSMSDSSPS